MEFSKEEITQIAGDEVIETNIKDNPKYEWIDVVGIPQRPEGLQSNLYLATHSEGKGGWDNGFDRRPSAAKVAYDKGWHLGLEAGGEAGGAEYLMVRDLDSLAHKLYEHARNESNPYIIGVTGSVGKTTTVAFLEHLLKTSESEVTRFYSKRLTPLSVMCHYINRVEQDTPFIVMEYSAYLKDHVAQLSELLPPNIAFLTNIYDTHINAGMFESKQDILESKVRVKPTESEGYINNRVLQELSVPMPKDWKGFNVELPEGLLNNRLPPTLRTAEMYTVGKLLSDEINLPPRILAQAFETFAPSENRILKTNYRGKEMFFHGETSGGSRLSSWFETLDGTCPWFMVEEVNFADEDPQGFKNLLSKVFDSDKSYVLDTPTNRERLPVRAHFVDAEEFGEILRDKVNGYAVYHKALATRNPGFEPEEYLNKRW
ncbi:MAG: hypothetical protein UT76_C0021G0007 [Candidatus Woesebacteria bacterium GW2011_GWB1_40_12]|uniref:Mur ligase central domain-containing protein n=1 Tax=Candidatus Woesebacteria bacterium GW2011_GWB1_40_12 TaxID=1618576 RepID=A0A0G0QQT7_9BACT|nr:MAG: hypothetical protein UT76_C0021G0007 [Candidatus Woesebacteria bacterium GW2011_GWB1_40_12]